MSRTLVVAASLPYRMIVPVPVWGLRYAIIVRGLITNEAGAPGRKPSQIYRNSRCCGVWCKSRIDFALSVRHPG